VLGQELRVAGDAGEAVATLLAPPKSAYKYVVDDNPAMTAKAVAAIANPLMRAPGRKSLVWVSAAFPLPLWNAAPPSGEAMARALQSIHDAALAIYPVNAAPLGGTSGKVAGDDPRAIAAATGGHAYLTADAVARALRDAASDADASYTLAFFPTAAELDSKPHQLRVEVKRAGVELRYRRAYLAAPDQPAQALGPQQVVDRLACPLDSTAVGITARAEYGERVRVHLSVPASDVTLQPGPKGWFGRLETVFDQRGANGESLGGATDVLALSFTAEERRKQPHAPIQHVATLEPSPQAAAIRILAHDRFSGRVGSLTIPFPRRSEPPSEVTSAGPIGNTGATFRTDTDLVTVHFQVLPSKGDLVADLRPEEIGLKVDGVVRPTAFFEGGRLYPRTMPIEITLLFDCSGSVVGTGLLDPRVFRTSLLDEYEHASIAIYAFADDLVRLTPATRDTEMLRKAMQGVLRVPTGGTPLFEYIAAAIRDAASTQARAHRMLVVLSDGESAARGDLQLVEKAVQEAEERGVSIYPVMLVRPADNSREVNMRRRDAPSLDRGPARLHSDLQTSIASYMGMARLTGGREFFQTEEEKEVLPRILRSLAQQIRYNYVAGYYPSNTGGKKQHKVEVVLKTKARGQIVGGSRTVVY
jgi:VWFA-related protein